MLVSVYKKRNHVFLKKNRSRSLIIARFCRFQCRKFSVRSPRTRWGSAKRCWASRTWYPPGWRNPKGSKDTRCSPTTGPLTRSSIRYARYDPTWRTRRCWPTTCWSPILRGAAYSGETWVFRILRIVPTHIADSFFFFHIINTRFSTICIYACVITCTYKNFPCNYNIFAKKRRIIFPCYIIVL